MNKNGEIIISNFQDGVAESPFLGNAVVKGCDITDTLGVLKIGKRVKKTIM